MFFALSDGPNFTHFAHVNVEMISTKELRDRTSTAICLSGGSECTSDDKSNIQSPLGALGQITLTEESEAVGERVVSVLYSCQFMTSLGGER
jgi:hypothetical protein